VIDGSGFYRGTARKDSRSLMNVTFRLPTEDLEKQFVADALKQGFGGLKGHRSVGGCRASIYNAATKEGIQALKDFMIAFEKENG
jgi:phosphoserine aminotransferase